MHNICKVGIQTSATTKKKKGFRFNSQLAENTAYGG